MSFLNKVKKNSNSSGSREFYPKKLGIYTIENPRIDKREHQPEVIALPPAHKTSQVTFKNETLSNITYWIGKLLCEPIVINIGMFPINAYYTGTDVKMFPESKTNFDKRIPLIGEEVGVTIPETYDLKTTVINERKDLIKKLGREGISEKRKEYLEKEMVKLDSMPDDGVVTTTHRVNVMPKIFIPMVCAEVKEVETEDGDIVQDYVPTVAIFEQSVGTKISEYLFETKRIKDKYDTIEAVSYLYGELAELQPDAYIQVFKNVSIQDSQKNPVLCAQAYNQKLTKATLPYFDLELPKAITQRQLFRVIILEMIGLFAGKDDKDSIEGMLKSALYYEIKVERDAEKDPTQD
jgi:hypothetical protein